MLLEKLWLPSPGRPTICEPWKTGSLFKPSGMLVGVVALRSSVETMVSGVGELAASEMTRLPVTVTDSTLVAALWANATVGSAARATPQASQCLIFKAMISP